MLAAKVTVVEHLGEQFVSLEEYRIVSAKLEFLRKNYDEVCEDYDELVARVNIVLDFFNEEQTLSFNNPGSDDV